MYIAEYDIARCKAPLDDPSMQEFVDNIDRVFALAESCPGFIWRHRPLDSEVSGLLIDDDPLKVENLSVWESLDALQNFLYHTFHVNYLKRGREWFDKLPVANVAIWHVEVGKNPAPEEGRKRLKHLQQNGESEFAFGLNSKQFYRHNNRSD